MSAGEEHLFDVSHRPGDFIEFVFKLSLFGNLSLDSVTSILVDCLGNLGVCPLVIRYLSGAEEWDELDAVFVESQRMAEVQNGVVRAGEWQVFWN